MITDKECEEIVIYLTGAYPQLKLNGIGTALAWENELNKIDATYEECQEICGRIIKNGFQDWEVNLSLVVEMIELERKSKESWKKSKQEEEDRISRWSNALPHEKVKSMIAEYRQSRRW